MVSEEQFIRLFVQHEAEFRAFALTLMPHRTEADDLLQDACVAMWRKIDSLQNEEVFRSWGYSFVRFTALNLRRKQNRSPLVFSDEMIKLMAAEGELEDELASAEYEALTYCVEALPAPQREVISKYYSSSRKTVVQLSEEMKKPVTALYKVLERARSALRECIEGKLKSEEPSI